jgi:hypothetical protein
MGGLEASGGFTGGLELEAAGELAAVVDVGSSGTPASASGCAELALKAAPAESEGLALGAELNDGADAVLRFVVLLTSVARGAALGPLLLIPAVLA